MRIKTVLNNKGETQEIRIEIPIKGQGGELGMRAVKNLTSLINGLKYMETEKDLKTHIYMIYGYAACCQQCDFLTEKSTNDLMVLAEQLANNELVRIREEKEGQA